MTTEQSPVYFLDQDNKAVPASIWEWSFDKAKRIVGDTILESGVRISTIFMGIDHAGEGSPQLFETEIQDGERHGELWRYATWEEAEAGHQRLVRELSSE
jgi:hypothetical protein